MWASMKVPPKRKGNAIKKQDLENYGCLNESPSEKEGKSPEEEEERHGECMPQ